jgi:hypothetical protein
MPMLQLLAAFMPAEWKGWNWFQRVFYVAGMAFVMWLLKTVLHAWLPPVH